MDGTPPQPRSFLGDSLEELRQLFAELGEPKYRATQLLQAFHRQGHGDVADMTNFSLALRERLAEFGPQMPLKLEHKKAAEDGTIALQFTTFDGHAVEAVVIRRAKRITLCISSQVGCALACDFCATGRGGFARDLTAAEIMAQHWYAQHRLGLDTRISNVVFMGMGEPLLNEGPVYKVAELLQDDHAYGLSRRRVTISTSGIVPAMLRMSDQSAASMVVSLHAANDDLRDKIVPINKKYPLSEVMEAAEYYVRSGEQKRFVTFAYTLLADVNDSKRDALELSRLVSDLPHKINLIPFNDFEESGYECPSPERLNAFSELLRRRGHQVTVRNTSGGEAHAACGQLRGRVKARGRVSKTSRRQVIASG